MNEKSATRRFGLAVWALYFVLSLAVIGTVLASRSPTAQVWLAALGLVQLVAGIVVCRRLLAEPLFGLRGWSWALLSLIALLAIEQGFVVHTLEARVGPAQAIAELARLTLLIGLAEELWFRGIGMALFANQRWISLVIGSGLFGLYHLAHGWLVVLLTAGVGLVFASARLRGAPLVVLGLAHGLLDWFNLVLFPGVRLRVDSLWLAVLFPAACVAASAAILALPTRSDSSPQYGGPS